MPNTRLQAAAIAVLALFVVGCGGDDVTAPDAAQESAAATTAPAEAERAEPTPSNSDEQDGPADPDPADPDPADPGPEDPGPGDFPVVIESGGGVWTLESAPQRIVSLSPMASEVLFAIGAGDQVVAVDSFSYYPPEAPVTDLSGWDPNVEAITAYEPDLVVIVYDANDLVASLTALDIPVLMSPAPADIESGYAAMADLGVATGRVDQTAEVIASLRQEMDEAAASSPGAPVRVYHELDETFFSASSHGFVGAVYAALGAENIADGADPDQTGFPQLTEEYIVEADPELIVISDLASYSPADVAARPGWEQIAAVRNGHIIAVNGDVASRWGPRLPQFVAAVAEALTSVVGVAP